MESCFCDDYFFGGKLIFIGQHWVVLEGYTANPDGTITFTYDGSSDNDARVGRNYVYGAEDLDKHEYSVDKIITINIHRH